MEQEIGTMLYFIGKTSREKQITVNYNGRQILDESMPRLRSLWRETSFQLKAQVSVKAFPLARTALSTF
jgi:hypothetical protein